MATFFKYRTLHLALAGAMATPMFSLAAPLTQDEIETANHLLLSPVVVTATRIEQNSFDLPVSIDAVNGETIRDSQAQVNLSEVSVRVPGVVVNNRFNLGQDLAISTRGFGARSQFGVRGVRLYADGIPMTMPDGQGQTGTFNLDTAKQVEFMRGPFSALYGNSSGGVVQILTKDGAKQPTVSGGITFGSYNTYRDTLTFEGEQSGLNYIVNASHYSTDGYRDHSSAVRDMLHAKLSFSPSDATKITLLATALDQPETQDPLSLTPAQYQQNPSQAGTNAVARNTRVDRTHVQSGLVVDHAISEQQSVRLMGYYGVRENLQYQQLGATGRVAGIDRNYGGLDARWTYKDALAGRPFTLTAGINYDTMDDNRKQYSAANGIIIPTPTRNEQQTVYNFDQFVQASFEPTDRWLLIAGLRHTRVNFEIQDRMPATFADPDGSGTLEFTNTSPVAGVTFKLTPAVNLYANYGRGFETPTFVELTYTNPATGTGPNLTVQPSKSRNYEIGAKAFVTDNTRVNAALFKVDTEKEIVTDLGTGTTASFKNAGDTERYGLELSLDSALPYNFNFYAAYTRMNAEFKDAFCTGSAPCTNVAAGNKIPGTYTSTTYAELSWKHPASGFSTAIEGMHFSDTFTNDANTIKADAFTLFNLRGGFVQKIGAWRLNEYARIDNLTDRVYVSSVRVNTAAAFEPGAPRNWTVGLNLGYQF
jgi:iron complex outermembrane receptor protein